LLVLVAASIAFLAGPVQAPANPNGLKALIVESLCNPSTPAATLRDQILGKSGGATVQLFDGAAATPSVAQLDSYDLVVAIGDCGWLAPVAMGDNLADFQDGGGVVVAAGADWRAGAGGRLFGRWISAGYSPYAVSSSTAFAYDTVGWQDSTSPLLSGIPSFQDDEGGSPLSAYYRDSVSPAGGAAEIARWTDGTPAVAVKGRAVGLNAYVGDHYGQSAWRGNFGALVVNAAEVLGRHTLTVGKRGNGRGVVTSAPLGIRCGKSCAADYVNGTEVTLTATALGPARFTGWTAPGCGGMPACAAVMNGPRTVAARFIACVVPALNGVRRKTARRRLKHAHCRLGGLRGNGKTVTNQSLKPGTVFRPGRKVKLRLG
jgi:hypothetical protein